MMGSRTLIVSAAAGIGLLAGPAWAVVIQTVPVGNPGNAGDSHHGGYGSVGYTFNIGKYEVTAGQYTEFLNAVAKTDTYGLYNPYMDYDAFPDWLGCNIKRSGSAGSYTYSVASDYANRPVNYVSWGDAARFANWLHNGQPTGAQDLTTTEDGAYYLNGATSDAALMAVTRKPGWQWAIPTEDEWYKAAYHKNDGVTANYWEYPTSNDAVPGRDLNDVSGNNANYYGANPYPIQSPYYTTVVGEFQNSDSPYGTFDQGGNVWEWNETVIYYGMYPPSRGLRGGSFHVTSERLHASHRDYGDYPTSEVYYLGFRVSQVPEPATVVMLALAGVGALRRRRA